MENSVRQMECGEQVADDSMQSRLKANNEECHTVNQATGLESLL